MRLPTTGRPIPFLLATAATVALVTFSSCKREERGFRVDAPAAQTTDKVTMSDLRPGSLQVTTSQAAATQSYAGPNVSPAIGLAPANQPTPRRRPERLRGKRLRPHRRPAPL